MNKFIITTGLIIGVTIRPVATWAGEYKNAKKSGFYAGLGLGATTLKSSMNIDSLNGNMSDNIRSKSDSTTAAFHGFIGYEHTFTDYVVGLEATYMYADAKVGVKNQLKDAGNALQESKDTVHMNHTYGLNVSFGRRWDRITPYVKLGLLSTSFTVSACSEGLNVSGHERKRLFGLAPGIGMRYALTDRLDLVTETQGAFYQSFKSKNFDSDAGDRHNVKVSPWFWMFMLGLRWKF